MHIVFKKKKEKENRSRGCKWTLLASEELEHHLVAETQ